MFTHVLFLCSYTPVYLRRIVFAMVLLSFRIQRFFHRLKSFINFEGCKLSSCYFRSSREAFHEKQKDKKCEFATKHSEAISFRSIFRKIEAALKNGKLIDFETAVHYMKKKKKKKLTGLNLY